MTDPTKFAAKFRLSSGKFPPNKPSGQQLILNQLMMKTIQQTLNKNLTVQCAETTEVGFLKCACCMYSIAIVHLVKNSQLSQFSRFCLRNHVCEEVLTDIMFDSI